MDLFSMFNEELNMVKKEFSRQARPELPLSQPWYAGRATWARILKRRIDIPMKVGGPVSEFQSFKVNLCIFISTRVWKELFTCTRKEWGRR